MFNKTFNLTGSFNVNTERYSAVEDDSEFALADLHNKRFSTLPLQADVSNSQYRPFYVKLWPEECLKCNRNIVSLTNLEGKVIDFFSSLILSLSCKVERGCTRNHIKIVGLPLGFSRLKR